jgi:hypothetical protein
LVNIFFWIYFIITKFFALIILGYHFFIIIIFKTFIRHPPHYKVSSMGNAFSSSPKYTSASNSSSNSSSSSLSNNSNNNTNNDSSNNSNDGLSYSSNSSSGISWYNAIKDKLKNEELCKSLGKEELNELIHNLGDETRFLEQFFYNDHLDQTTKVLQKLDDQKSNIPSEKYARNLINNLLQQRKSGKFNVYLFISKLSDNRSDSPFLRFLANSLFKNKYGMFHVGLEINGIVLEWGTGDAGPHLIYPRVNAERMYENIAHICVNYGQEFDFLTNLLQNNLCYTILDILLRNLQSFVPEIGIISSNKLQIISQKCVYWNKNFHYNPLNRNCQHFIDEIFEALGLKFNPEGEFKKFLDRIVMYADDRFLFQEDEFLSRQDLDQYADQNWYKILNVWDKRLLLCYSDMMNNMYEYKHEEKWGPISNKKEWKGREEQVKKLIKSTASYSVDC